jgi:hypothetical protein
MASSKVSSSVTENIAMQNKLYYGKLKGFKQCNRKYCNAKSTYRRLQFGHFSDLGLFAEYDEFGQKKVRKQNFHNEFGEGGSGTTIRN